MGETKLVYKTFMIVINITPTL